MDKVLLTAKYFDGELNANECLTFENNVRKDLELQEYLSYYAQINKKFNKHIAELLNGPNKANYRTMSEHFKKEELSFFWDNLWYISWVVVFVIAILVWSPWKTDLYKEYGIENVNIARSLRMTSFEDFDKAANYLDENKMYEAKLIVAKAYSKNPDNAELAIQYSSILLNENKFETLRLVLGSLTTSGDIENRSQANYLMALSYLKENNYEECANWLAKVDLATKFAKKSSSLLSVISNNDFQKPASIQIASVLGGV